MLQYLHTNHFVDKWDNQQLVDNDHDDGVGYVNNLHVWLRNLSEHVIYISILPSI